MKYTHLRHTIIILASLAAVLSLQACGSFVVSGAAAGTAVAHDRRTIGTVVDDQSIKIQIYKGISDDEELFDRSHISVTSYNHVVLIAGQTPTQQMKDRMQNIVKNVRGVREIYNELVLGEPTSLAQRTNDTFITAKIKGALLNITGLKDFDVTRVTVETESGVVYLMGLLSEHEANVVTEKVRRVSGVKKVVKLFEYPTK